MRCWIWRKTWGLGAQLRECQERNEYLSRGVHFLAVKMEHFLFFPQIKNEYLPLTFCRRSLKVPPFRSIWLELFVILSVNQIFQYLELLFYNTMPKNWYLRSNRKITSKNVIYALTAYEANVIFFAVFFVRFCKSSQEDLSKYQYLVN